MLKHYTDTSYANLLLKVPKLILKVCIALNLVLIQRPLANLDFLRDWPY